MRRYAADGTPLEHDVNLFVGGIHPDVDEQTLCEEFGRFGPIASVKIIWPRTQEEHMRGRNTGFVAFMKRRDAEQAMRRLDGKELMGFTLRIGWGRPVPLPAQPSFGKSKDDG